MGLSATESNSRSQDTEALYREHGGAVARLCRSLLRDRGEAEDATQQVFLSAHRALLNGTAPREPLAWLLAVARNECYARFRQRALSPVPAGEVPDGATADASAQVLRAGELAQVWDEVGRMPTAQRDAFLLREIRGLSYGQVADELSLSPPSVRSLLLRARKRLRQRLGDVAAGLGSAPWVQTLVRLVTGGDGTSPVPLGKAAAIGVGALALAGGGGLVARHASRTLADPAGSQKAPARLRHVAPPEAVAVTPVAIDERHSGVDRSRSRDNAVRGSGSGESGSRDTSGEVSTSSGDGSTGGSHDGSSDTAAVAQPTDGHDGGSSSSSGSGSGTSSGSTTTSPSSDGGSTSGSGSGSDDGSSTTATTTTTTPDPGGSGSDGG